MKPKDATELTRTTAGTVMGDYLRDHWVPVLRSQAVSRGGRPAVVRLFGEDYVVFRSTDGSVGLVDESCPHRKASLSLARNEDCALTCLYHGWRIATDGHVAEAPTERAGFDKLVRTRQHGVVETGDVIWGYVGPRPTPPTFPAFEFTALTAEHVYASVAEVGANWVQVFEGVFDPLHIGYLHGQLLGPGAGVLKIHPTVELEDTRLGFEAAVTRALPEELGGVGYTRVKVAALPFFGFVPDAPADMHTCIIPVPADDEHTHMWYVSFDADKAVGDYDQQFRVAAAGAAAAPGGEIDRNNFRSHIPGRSQRWGQDAEAMAGGHLSGLPGLVIEDVVILESQHPIQDRTTENLGSSDRAVTHLRRRLLDEARRHAAEGRRDDTDVDFAAIRSTTGMGAPDGAGWRDFPRWAAPAADLGMPGSEADALGIGPDAAGPSSDGSAVTAARARHDVPTVPEAGSPVDATVSTQ